MTADATPVRDPRRTARFWILPLMAVVLLATVLATAYLGGNVNPRKNLHGFPIAVVNADWGSDTVSGEKLHAGDEVEKGLKDAMSDGRFDVRELTAEEAREQMNRGELYGAIVIPYDFSQKLNAWGIGTAVPIDVEQPEIRIIDNPRAGLGAANVMNIVGRQVSERLEGSIGDRLVAQIKEVRGDEVKDTPGTAMAAAAAPVKIAEEDFRPLPDGTGNGLSAFYFTLLIVLAGLTGSVMVNTLVDSRLGFMPSEMGPLVLRRPEVGVSRLGVFGVKVLIAAVAAVVVSAIYVAIGTAVGMPIGRPWLLALFTGVAIFSVATVCQAVNALLGSIGLLVNLILFIIVGLPSAGGTLPLEAVPEFFRAYSHVAPMHQIFLGARSVLYFDGQWDAGLGQSLRFALLATAAALLIGGLGTWLYDRRGFTRHGLDAGTPGKES
ncbi:YhgE/Pip domain-containing protein [Corynebacterium sp. 335C]